MDDGGEGWILERKVVIGRKERSDLVKLLRNLNPDNTAVISGNQV